MDASALGQYISLVFMPHIALLAGGVIVVMLALLIYIALRDGLLKEVSL